MARRASSADPGGANKDFVTVAAKASHRVADLRGAGRIVHLWFTISTLEPEYLRTTRLRMFWDGEAEAAVDVPWGDFFALGHGTVRQISSAFLTVVARPDYQEMKAPPGRLRFHARYQRSEAENRPDAPKAPHTILETKGRGHLAGVVLSVDTPGNGWWEGDEAIWVDGGAKPPIEGTGTEDYSGGAYGFRREYNTPYHGVSYLEKFTDRPHWQAGKYTMHRFHERDPIPFTRSLRMTIERGHGNARMDSEYVSVAYWYQE